MKPKTGLFFLLALSLTISCSSPEGEESVLKKIFSDDTLPPANGGILDILVVAEDKVWNGGPGRAFEEHFIGMVYGLPQPEPRYTVRQVAPKEFSDLLKRSRYIVLLDAKADSSSLVFEMDKWARGQMVTHLSAPTELDLRKLTLKQTEAIDARISALESKRLYTKMEPLTHKEYPEFFSKHNLKLNVPRDFALSVSTDDVVVYWKTTTLADNGIIIYVGDLPEDEAIIGNNIIPLRDSLTKLYVPGQRDGSYMITEDLVKPQLNPTEVQGRFSIEARGLWRTHGDIMGGPFVSYTIYDEENNRLIYIDSFILAPEKKKRKSLFELESIIRNLEIL